MPRVYTPLTLEILDCVFRFLQFLGNWQGLRGTLKTISSKAADEKKPEAYPPGYVEDFFESRTPLEEVFSVLAGEGVLFGRVRRSNLVAEKRIPLGNLLFHLPGNLAIGPMTFDARP
jgi:hypothetical protein